MNEGQKIDVYVDSDGMVIPGPGNGASTFANVDEAPLTGHYWTIREGTPLPDGLGIIADGSDVLASSTHQPTHHTIYPTLSMTPQEFINLFRNLPWEYGGRKR